MNVMIADDEVQIRKGLRMKMDWEKEGFSIVVEASDGQEALEMLSKYNIDIAITDIKMPIMDGIEFFKQCHIKYPELKIIVLSGYADFEYVRSAMQVGVKDYLLKPVAPDELVETLQKVRVEIEKERSELIENTRIRKEMHNQLQELQEQYLLHLVKEEWSELTMAFERLHHLQLKELTSKDTMFQFVTVEIRTSEEVKEDLQEMQLPFQMICREFAAERENIYAFYDPSYSNMLHFLVRIPFNSQFNIKAFAQDIQKTVNSFLKVETVIGIGKEVKGLSEFKNGYISSLLSWSQSKVGNQSQVVDHLLKEDMVEFSPHVERKLINAIENLDSELFRATIESILGKNKSYSVISFVFLANRLLLLLSSLARKYDLDMTKIQNFLVVSRQSVWELNSQQKVMNQLIELGKEMIDKLQQERRSGGSHIVEGVRRYLEKNYANDITLTILAKQFHINGTYLSDIFKTHVGQTFSDYLINLRIENSKGLLQDAQLKITDVAHLVGFSNSGYFSTVFKKHVGQTPVEYRKEKLAEETLFVDDEMRGRK